VRRIIIIVNSGAGSFSQKLFDHSCRQLESAGVAVQRSFCSDFAEMTEKAAETSRQPGSPVVVAAGGDGTINAVLNGLAGNSATCSILPMGTANVMALELGIRSAGQAIARISAGQPQSFTAGLLQNDFKSSRFFLMAGIGFDGHIVRGVSLREKKLLGKSAYLLSALRCLTSWDSSELQVTTETEQFSCGTLIVCNAALYGGSFTLAPSADIFSPSFELTAIKGSSRSAAIRAMTAAVSAKEHSEQLHRTNSSKIIVTGFKPVQADGDEWGDSPVKIAAEPDYAKILI